MQTPKQREAVMHGNSEKAEGANNTNHNNNNGGKAMRVEAASLEDAVWEMWNRQAGAGDGGTAGGSGAQKDEAACEALKAKANAHFKQGDFELAAHLYTQALALCPASSRRLLAALLTNRSVAHRHLHLVALALQDVVAADQVAGALFPKLFVRKAECLLALGRVEDARVAVKEGLEAAEASPDQEPGVVERLHALLAKATAGKESSPNVPLPPDAHPVQRTALVHPSLRVGHDAKQGRFLRTAGGLEVGIQAVVSPPLCVVEMDRHARPRCAWCLREGGSSTSQNQHQHQHQQAGRVVGFSFLPCLGCADALYCSLECLRLHRSHGHWLECGAAHALKPLRSAVRLGVHLLCCESLAMGRDGDNPPSWGDHQQHDREWAGRVVSNSHRRYGGASGSSSSFPPPPGDGGLLQQLEGGMGDSVGVLQVGSVVRAGASERKAFLRDVCCATHVVCAKLRGLGQPVDSARDQRAVLNACLVNALRARANSFTVRHLALAQDGFLEEVPVATAVYSVPSLLNHSCRPNCTVQFVGADLVVRVCAAVGLGGQLHVSYGPVAGRHTRKHRQDTLLRNYDFECECEACERPDARSVAYRCPVANCQGRLVHGKGSPSAAAGSAKCSHCKAEASQQVLARLLAFPGEFDKLRQAFHATLQPPIRASKARVGLALRALEFSNRTLLPPHHAIAEAHDMAARAWVEESNLAKALEHTRAGCAMVRELFGESSVEGVREAVKLAQIGFNCVREGQCGAAECVRVRDEVVATLRLASALLEPSDPDVLELRHMSRVLVAGGS